MKFLLLILSVCAISGAYDVSPRRPEPMIIINSGSNTVPVAYDASTGSQLVTSVNLGVTRMQVFNEGSENLLVFIGKGPCAGITVDHFVIPAGGGNEVLKVSPGDHVCLRSSGLAQSSGKVFLSQW